MTVLSILTAVSSLTVVYPKVVPTVVFIPTVVYMLTVVSSLSDYSPQHSPHSYFHVIFISAYPAVRINFIHTRMSSDLITYHLLERKAVCKPATTDITTRREETNAGTNANDSFGKGFDMLKDHVPNRLMTGCCQSKSLQLRPEFHSLFLQISFDFQSATFKTLKSSPRMYISNMEEQFQQKRLNYNTRRRQKKALETDRESKRIEIEERNDFCKIYGCSEVNQKELQNPMKEKQLD